MVAAHLPQATPRVLFLGHPYLRGLKQVFLPGPTSCRLGQHAARKHIYSQVVILFNTCLPIKRSGEMGSTQSCD